MIGDASARDASQTARLSGRPVSVSRAELDRRRRAIAALAAARGCDLFVGLDTTTVRYLSGYPVELNERPFAVIVDSSGRLTLFAPLLKARDALARSHADRIVSYDDYPGLVPPLAKLAELIGSYSSVGSVLLEKKRHYRLYGYQGPALKNLIAGPVVLDERVVQKMRMVKSAEEILLLRHASDWAVFAQGILKAEVAAGLSESHISGRASGMAMTHLRNLYGEHEAIDRAAMVAAGFGGQIGAAGTAHHVQTEFDPIVRTGDLMITRVPARIGGYYSDIERTMICGPATIGVVDLFQRGLDIHHFALEQVRPGQSVGMIDRKVRERFEALGVADCWRHHVGHSVGLQEREAPYVDIGGETVLEPGMIVTVEPGLYRDGVGGFRHSDCLLVTNHGAEILTEYPRTLSDLTC